MKTLEQHLIQYARYHRDKRNILTHFAGIPLIVFAVLALTSLPQWQLNMPIVGNTMVTPAMVVWALSNVFYLKLDRMLGVAMTVFTGLLLLAAHYVATFGTAEWLTVSVGTFVFGWLLQFIGHYYEGKKPAFVDDLVGLVIGPLFVMAEWCFALGFKKSLQARIDSEAGIVRINGKSNPA